MYEHEIICVNEYNKNNRCEYIYDHEIIYASVCMITK